MKRIIGRLRREIINIRPNLITKLKRSNWYHTLFPHLSEYERLKQGADVICIGSTPARNAIDFSRRTDIKGYNLAVAPETIYYDFQVLKNYHSYLKEGGTVLLVLCPFTFMKDYYRDENGSKSYLNIRYYPILHRAMIDTFDINLYHKYVENPFLISKRAWTHLFHDTKPPQAMNTRTNPQAPSESRMACEIRVQKWMKEFHLTDLNPLHISPEINEAINGNIKIYQEMKSFIEERNYNVTIIVPPFPDEMVSLLPKDLVEYTLMRPIKATGIPYLSYYGNKAWLSRDLYYHGFLLNAKGRELLTEDILTKIEL